MSGFFCFVKTERNPAVDGAAGDKEEAGDWVWEGGLGVLIGEGPEFPLRKSRRRCWFVQRSSLAIRELKGEKTWKQL